MKDPEKIEHFIKKFESVAHDISERTHYIVYLQEKIETAYNNIYHTAFNKISAINNHRTLDLGLMEKILQREVIQLFKPLETLRKSLLLSTRKIIENTNTLVNEAITDFPVIYIDRLETSILSLAKSLNELKKSELLLSSRNYAPHQ